MDHFSLELIELNGSVVPVEVVSRAEPKAARRVLDCVAEALKGSDLELSLMDSPKAQCVTLEEEPGVRLALTLLATKPIQKRERVDAIKNNISAMGSEEAYYWYAKCTGPNAGRATRAFRLLLAAD